MVTSIVSALTGIKVKSTVAMTGEITLRGRVLPIGGLKEKLLAAKRGGIKTVLIPIDNKKDLNLEFIELGGWHFTNIKSPEAIDYKMRSFLHHLEYEKSGFNSNKLKQLILEKKVLYNHNADKKNSDKWKDGK